MLVITSTKSFLLSDGIKLEIKSSELVVRPKESGQSQLMLSLFPD